MTSDRASDPVSANIIDALSLVKRLHDDYWGLVLSVEESINNRRFEQAELILSTLGGDLKDTYHFRQQAARLMAARGKWPELFALARDLLQISPQDEQNIGLMIVACAELRDFRAALSLIDSVPSRCLTATWAMETLFRTLGHQDRSGLDIAPAIRKASAVTGRGKMWEAHAFRLAGEYKVAEKLLLPLTRNPRADISVHVELALTRINLPNWHEHASSYEALLGKPGVAPHAVESLRRALDMYEILKAGYKQAVNVTTDYHLPDSFLEVVFDRTCNVIYPPTSGRVALVGATMAAGGAERVLGSAFAGLRESGSFTSELWLYSRNSAMQHDFFFKELALDRLHADACFDLTFEAPRVPFSYLPAGMAHNAQAVHAMIAARRPAILHAWQDTTNLEVAFAGVVAGVPKIILHPHNMRPDLIHRAPVIGSLRRGYRALLKRRDVHIIFVSEASRRDYLEWLDHDGHERCHVVYNGFECPKELSPRALRYRRTAIREELGIPEDATVVGGIFRFHKVKRPKLWLDVAASVLRRRPALVFAIFGDGPEFELAKSYAKELGISKSVIFAGKVKAADEKVVAFDALLHTSATEGLPTVIIEAQVAGVPVVAFGTGGVPECVHPTFSHICKGDDAKELSDALMDVLAKPPKDAAARAASRIIRQRFSRKSMIESLERIYSL